MRKNKLLLLLALLLTAATGAWAQTEITTIPNGDFETWTYDGEDMPNYWNSNATSDGSLAAMSGGKQLKRSTDVRPGSSGQYSCSIWSKSTMGVINIGILTSGRIHFGSMSSTNNANYIYSDRDGSNTKNNFTNPCAMPFTGKPTAIKVWVKYVQGGTGYGNYATAKFSATIHGDADYVAYNLAEHDNDDNKALVVASAEQEIAYNNGEWEQITIPFNYTDNNVDPAYILINAYTNAYPGKGKANDYLYIDDIELEYAPEPGIASTYTVSLKDGVKDADKWTVKVGEGEAQALPIGGLKGDGSETVTLQYNGRLKVKGVKATSDAAPAGNIVDLSTLTADYEAQNGDVLTGVTTSYKVTIAAGATVTLDGVTINRSSYCIKCLGDATIILKDGSTNTLTGTGTEYPALSIGDANTTLTIQGSTGVLNVTSGNYCAGIGGGYSNTNSTCGNITIANTVTKVTATKGAEASHSIGKGYGDKATCGTVTIGGTKYWENNAAVNGGDTYLAQSPLIYDPTAQAKPAATVTTAPTGAEIVGVGKSTALVSGGVADGGTLWYAVTTTNTKPTSTAGFSDAVPTAKEITASGTVYVWYYVKGDDSHSDSEIAGPVSVTVAPASTTLDNTITAWTAGTYAVPAGGLTYSDAITVSGDVTLVLTDGETLTLNKGISLAEGATLTIQGNGTMNVNGSNENASSTVAGTGMLVLTSGTLNAKGGNGQSMIINSDGGEADFNTGASGGVAINGNVTVNGGTVTATGGNGGNLTITGEDDVMNDHGGNGGAAISGSVTVNTGTWTATNGSNGILTLNSETEPEDGNSAGTGGKAVAGTVTDNR